MSKRIAAGPAPESAHAGFIIAWLFCIIFYFLQYALRSAPSVMLPEITHSFAIDAAAASTLIGLYYYTYALCSILAGASLDRFGAKYSVPVGVVLVAVGAVLFGLGYMHAAQFGRLFQGAGSAMAFTGAVYLATHGFPPRYLATAVGFTQCFGMLGGSAGQFGVRQLIHGVMGWQQFWYVSGVALAVTAVLLAVVTPRSGDVDADGHKPPISRMFGSYLPVLRNPQSYLCGFIAGLLFLPTTIGSMNWGVPFLREGLHAGYSEAVDRASMVALGWVLGCPLLGYISDHIGRRKPVLIGGALIMLATLAAIVYLPPDSVPHYVLGLILGVASGAAMIPYSMIKEVNPDRVKGSATGAMNFLVFTFSALLTPVFADLVKHYGHGALNLHVFREAGLPLLLGVVVAIVLAFFLRETGLAGKTKATA